MYVSVHVFTVPTRLPITRILYRIDRQPNPVYSCLIHPNKADRLDTSV